MLIAAAIVFAASTIFFAFFYAYHSGQELTVYSRFKRIDEKGKEAFNLWALLSPLQVESQKVISDTTHFVYKVVYPFAPHFEIAPVDSNDYNSLNSSENFVADKIARKIYDTINAIQFQLKGDYDRQCIAVRNAANPKSLPFDKPSIGLLSLVGTSSPEARKYGLRESLMPGHTEKENGDLAYLRLRRTDTLLCKKLLDLGIRVQGVLITGKELQLNNELEVDSVMTHLSVLDTMRYVSADITITSQHLLVTPAIAPVALPFWLLSLLGLLLFIRWLWRGRRPISQPDWKEILEILFLLLLFLLVIALIYYFLIGIIIVAAILSFICLIILLIFIFKEIFKLKWIDIWNFIEEVLFWIIALLILMVLLIFAFFWMLYDYLRRFITWFRVWWKGECVCCKIFFIITLIVLITRLLGWWHIIITFHF